MMHNRQLPICLLDFVLGRVLLNAEYLVEVLALALLELQLSVTDFLLDTGFIGVRFGYCAVFAEGVFPGARFAKSAGSSFAGFEVGGVKSESTGTVGERGFVVFDLTEQLV
jgi:hypothetical protein